MKVPITLWLVLASILPLAGVDLEVAPKVVIPLSDSGQALDAGGTLGVSMRTQGRYGWGFVAGLEAGGLPGDRDPSVALWAVKLGPSWQTNWGEAWVWSLGANVGLSRASQTNLAGGDLHLWLSAGTSLRVNLTPGVGFALGAEYQNPLGLYRALGAWVSFVVEGAD